MKAITGATTLAAVIGAPARHSLSPAIHNAAFAACELDWVYVAFDVAPGSAAVALDAMRTLGWGGLSVTMPHKTDVARAVDACSGAAAALDAVNCVVPDGGGLRGENTDGSGFVAGLIDDTGQGVADQRVLVFGAGGAARAVIAAVTEAGAADVGVHNRSADRAAAAAALAGERGHVVGLDEIDGYDVVVNATPIGMSDGTPGAMPCAVDRLGGHQRVVDLVYEPAETAWLRALRLKGVEAHNGLSMLVHQAAVAFELWTGEQAPVAVMRDAVRRELGGRTH